MEIFNQKVQIKMKYTSQIKWTVGRPGWRIRTEEYKWPGKHKSAAQESPRSLISFSNYFWSFYILCAPVPSCQTKMKSESLLFCTILQCVPQLCETKTIKLAIQWWGWICFAKKWMSTFPSFFAHRNRTLVNISRVPYLKSVTPLR